MELYTPQEISQRLFVTNPTKIFTNFGSISLTFWTDRPEKVGFFLKSVQNGPHWSNEPAPPISTFWTWKGELKSGHQ